MAEGKLPEQIWPLMQKRLGYSDEEMEVFRNNPRNARVLEVGREMANKTIVFEVVQSQGCNSNHTAGTKFYFTGDGNLISKLAPKHICVFVMPVMAQAIFALQELWYAGIDPNQIKFRRGGCFDVGLECGGWGHIVLEARVVDRSEVVTP